MLGLIAVMLATTTLTLLVICLHLVKRVMQLEAHAVERGVARYDRRTGELVLTRPLMPQLRAAGRDM